MAEQKPFIRVRDKRTRHEFDVHRQAFDKENYEVLKDVPDSWSSRPPKPHIPQTTAKSSTSRASSSSRRSSSSKSKAAASAVAVPPAAEPASTSKEQ